ncbi:JAB domain-containing protein [Pedobacter duraquae]|uniref:DNA repair protein RadC n=1 Tax=Pedobacter duraquae TaxID=425511 RepID=A0A4R6IHD6_9SPHI|nr:JAB domain-containing protein [Pedobacter duraquae]TDO21331.1 DNA repair protein RadC [Pedobacter duraquae]
MVNKTFKVAEIELAYKPNYKTADKPKIKDSNGACQILIDHWDQNKIGLLEEFKILLMNRGNRVLGVVHISSGGMGGTVADPKLIFAAALKSCANGIILSHNHPSGETQPSQEDITITRKLKHGGKLLDIQILDHIIIGHEEFYSFSD